LGLGGKALGVADRIYAQNTDTKQHAQNGSCSC
jgi:hypothetical protein